MPEGSSLRIEKRSAPKTLLLYTCSKCGVSLGVEDHFRIMDEHLDPGQPCSGGHYRVIEYAPTGVVGKWGDVWSARQRDQALAEVEALRAALVGDDPLDPRWTWLPGIIERLEEHAPADEDPLAMRDAACVLQTIYNDLRALMAASGQEQPT
jgi:hypothetical protein